MRLLLLLCCLLPLSLQAATTLKISTLYPDGTSVVERIKQAGDTIEEKTGGRVSLKLYPGGVMGDDQSVQRKIRVGQLHGALAQGGAFSRHYKDSQVYNTPLAFRTFDEVDHVRAELDPVLREGFEEAGWISFGFIDGGFAYIMSSQPVRTPEELREQKIWLPANDSLSKTLADTLDVSPIMLNIGSVLTSLQTGAIDAFAAPAVAALTLQWHSRIQYLTDMPLMYTYGMLAFHEKHFSKLKKADQQVVRDVLGAAVAELDEASREDNREAYQALLKQDVEAVTPDAEQLKVWRDYAGQATEKLIEKGEFSAAMHQRLNKLLSEYRSNTPED